MNITPQDIRKQIFKKSFRGYDQEEVQAFLEMLATEVEHLNSENIELKEFLNALQSEVHHYQSIEQTLQEMLRTAQQTAEEVKENGHKEARLIVKEAEIRSNRAIEKARTQVHEIRTELVELQNQRDMCLSKFKALVQVQTDFLDQFQMTSFDVVKENIPEIEDDATDQDDENA